MKKLNRGRWVEGAATVTRSLLAAGVLIGSALASAPPTAQVNTTGLAVTDSSVKVGQWRELNAEERRDLLKVVDLKDRRPWGSLARRPGARKPAQQAGSPWKTPRRR